MGWMSWNNMKTPGKQNCHVTEVIAALLGVAQAATRTNAL